MRQSSIVSGCWAWCGCSLPAYTLSFESMAVPSLLFGKHAPHRFGDDLFRIAGHHFRKRDRLLPAGVLGVPLIRTLRGLGIARYLHLIRVDHHHELTGIHVRGVLRTVLSHQDHCNARGCATENLPGNVDYVPLLLDLARLCHERLHDAVYPVCCRYTETAVKEPHIMTYARGLSTAYFYSNSGKIIRCTQLSRARFASAPRKAAVRALFIGFPGAEQGPNVALSWQLTGICGALDGGCGAIAGQLHGSWWHLRAFWRSNHRARPMPDARNPRAVRAAPTF